MTKQVVDYGGFADDPTADSLYVAFGKVVGNFDDLYVGSAYTERDSASRLVYPYIYTQTNDYNGDGTLNYIETANGGTTWRQTFAYNVDGTVATITAIDGTNTWVKTLTYLAGQLTSSTGWVI